MIDFIQQHTLLVLSIIGLVLGFLASISEFVAKRKPVLFVVVIAILTLVVAVAYQIYDFNQKQEEARQQAAEKQLEQTMQQTRDDIIKKIDLNVSATKITIETIAQRLKSTELNDVATRMVTVMTSGAGDFEETMAFAKGSAEMWFIYADWLESLGGKEVAPSLSITFNAHHHYNAGLLLAYLLTSTATRADLEAVVTHGSQWKSFNAEQLYLVNLNQASAQLQWVLFYDQSAQNLVGFADAQDFIRELMTYHSLGKHEEIEDILNHPSEMPIAALQNKFSSIQTAVFKTESPSNLVGAMINQQLAVSVAAAGPRPYVVHLERMIKLAASPE
jgi:hypothetical protein